MSPCYDYDYDYDYDDNDCCYYYYYYYSITPLPGAVSSFFPLRKTRKSNSTSTKPKNRLSHDAI